MCGIAGIINSSKTPIDARQLEEISNIMQHRGPDAQGFYINENVGFAHNRLSLLDLSNNANQPFKNENYALVFNGEIYNWQSLRAELESTGAIFTTTSDTEVLFKGLTIWGVENTINKLKGMFAFVWHNIKENTVYLVRDRVGIKPLFYANINNQFLFASEIKALCANLGMDDLNMHYLSQAYYGVYETQRHISPFKQIKQLEPGHMLVCNTQTLEINDHQWFGLENWANETEYKRRENLSADEICDEFSDLFGKSVNSMAIADAPMGSFVSGGLDSSVVSATSKEFANLELFTANVVGKYSEFEAATKLANHLNTNLNEYKYLPEYFIRDIVDATYHHDAPITLFTNSVAFSGVAKLARDKQVKAVLTGEGADELFLGYPQLLTQRYDKALQTPYSLINAIYKKIPGLSNLFSNISLTHGYNGSLSMNSFSSSLLYTDDKGYSAPRFRDPVSGNYVPYFLIPNITISERMEPLIGLNITTITQWSIRFEYKKSRILALSLVDYQLSENNSTEWIIGTSYRKRGLKLPFNIPGLNNSKLANDLTFRLDLAVRDVYNTNSRLDQTNAYGTGGQKEITLQPSVDYVLNSKINLKFFFDQRRATPYISSAPPITNTRAGVNVRIAL